MRMADDWKSKLYFRLTQWNIFLLHTDQFFHHKNSAQVITLVTSIYWYPTVSLCHYLPLAFSVEYCVAANTEDVFDWYHMFHHHYFFHIYCAMYHFDLPRSKTERVLISLTLES